MNFQPTDYINNLNFDFDEVSPSIDSNDLDLFSQVEFFDLDVFSQDSVLPNKKDVTATTTGAAKQEVEKAVKQTKTKLSSPDDKRKRNTAASARFRIKKKLKEQQMEENAQRLEEKVVLLEKQLKSLEMENKCLKNLILQKNEEKNSTLLDSIKKKSILDFEYKFTT